MQLAIGLSTVRDGSMARKGSSGPEEVTLNRRRFLEKRDMLLEYSVLVQVVYQGNDYCRFHNVDAANAGDGMVSIPTLVSDALFTRTPGLGLFLPLADCVGAVAYDPINGVLAMIHLGRHNLEQQCGTKAIAYMQQHFGSQPKDIEVFLSPAAGRENYPLFAFENQSLHQVATQQLLAGGIAKDKLTAAPEDTTTHPDYFSHSQFLRGQQLINGRHAVVAQIRQQVCSS